MKAFQLLYGFLMPRTHGVENWRRNRNSEPIFNVVFRSDRRLWRRAAENKHDR